MSKQCSIPAQFSSPLIAAIKLSRKRRDQRKKDFKPTLLDFGSFTVKLARHFGFCFGVENAIQIAYRAVAEHPEHRVFLLGEMIHNPVVNNDLAAAGVQFLDISGSRNSWEPVIGSLNPNDVVIVPAFGTTIEIQQLLIEQGIDPYFYDTTCPFVEKVWRRAETLGQKGFTVAIHGKRFHEETLATFSHASQSAPIIVLAGVSDAEFLIGYLKGQFDREQFWERFHGCTTDGFDPAVDLERIGVVNQTTMLASETYQLAQVLKQGMTEVFPADELNSHFADTRDTLCYATSDNQQSTRGLIQDGVNLALVVGGYNSSNTSHLVKLCQSAIPTYYIKDSTEILSPDRIRHFSIESKNIVISNNWLPDAGSGVGPLAIGVTSGASCPDRTVEDVLRRLSALLNSSISLDSLAASFQ